CYLSESWRGVASLSFSPDSRLFAVGLTGPEVQIWDVAEPQLQGKYLPEHTPQTNRLPSFVAFRPAGGHLAVAHHVQVTELAVAADKVIRRLAMPTYWPARTVKGLIYHGYSTLIASGYNFLISWNESSNEGTLNWPDGNITNLACSSD